MNFIKAFIKKYIYSAIGIFLIVVVVVAVNALLRKVNARYDLTEDKIYTLSQGTKNILGKLKSPVTIRFYCSRSENQMPVQLRGFTARLEDLLDEYVSTGNGRIILDKFDPQPDSDAEYSAAMDGISGEMMPDGRKFYLGIAVSCLDKTIRIPIAPSEENLLEYNMTRSIYEASQGKMPVLGIMTDLPVMGGNTTPFMKSQTPKPPWIFVQELKKNFTVNQISTKTTRIDNDVKVLFIIHPQKLAPETIYAIDQYLLSGGRLVIALDPFCLAEQRSSPQAMMGQQVMPGSSSIPELLKAWGLSFSNEVLVDMDNSARNINDPQSGSYPAVLDFLNIKNVSDDPSMAGIPHLNLIYAGAFVGAPELGISAKIFLESSQKSQLINAFKAQSPSAAILKEFVPSNKNEKMILKLAGKFKSAFPDGKPAKKDDKKPEATPEPPSPPGDEKSLRESTNESTVVLLADVDMLSDEFCVSKQTLFGRTVVQPFNDNLNLIQNICGQLAGDNDLIQIRCRKVKERPFTELVKIQTAAQQKFEKKILEIEEEKASAQTRLNQLQSGKAESQKFIMTPEQKQEIANFKEKVAEKNKELKELRKEFRKDIERTILRYEIVNIAVVPLLVVLFGLCVYMFNRIRSNRRR